MLRGLARGLEARLAAAIRRLEPARRRGLDEPATSRQLLLVNAARTLSELRHALAWPGTAPRELFGLLRNGFAAAAACVGIAAADAMPLYRDIRLKVSAASTVCCGRSCAACSRKRRRWSASVRTANSCAPNSPKVWAGHRPYSYSKPKKPFPPCSMRDALWPMLHTLPATLAQAIAGVPLREIPAPPGLPQRDGIHYLEPDARSERWQAALRSGALGVALFPLCGPALPGHLRLLYLLEELNHAARLLRPVFPPDAPFAG